jgi:hypothetical protein
VSVRRPRALAPLILACPLATLLLVPVAAGAASSQFGSSLAAGPAGVFGCNAKPSKGGTAATAKLVLRRSAPKR